MTDLPHTAAAYRDTERALLAAIEANTTAFKHHRTTNTAATLRAWERTIGAVQTARDAHDQAADQLVTAALNHTCGA